MAIAMHSGAERFLGEAFQPMPDRTKTPVSIYYLEYVTADVDNTCKLLSALHGVTFSPKSDPNLGGARTTMLKGGGLVGVRAPLRESEKPIVRAYNQLTSNILTSIKAAEKLGATVALPPTNIEQHGACAIIIYGGLEIGLWQPANLSS
ncbi:MAG: hypothetical protein KF824_03950 [Fimbriimonadaceae bacterium]|nr:MAG: hypothetical protein KF824_03950 [Fimbriimonadaceae bacterium]